MTVWVMVMMVLMVVMTMLVVVVMTAMMVVVTVLVVVVTVLVTVVIFRGMILSSVLRPIITLCGTQSAFLVAWTRGQGCDGAGRVL